MCEILLGQANERVGFQIQTQLSEWGLQLSPTLAETDGRILPNENIYVEGKHFSSGPDVDWTRNLRSSRMLHTIELKKWALVYPSKMDNVAKTFFRLLQDCGKGMAFQVPPPKP